MTKETDSKPFYTVYAKHRHWLNPLIYVLGEYKFKWFEKDKQPQKYKNVFHIFATSNLKVKDVIIEQHDTTTKN